MTPDEKIRIENLNMAEVEDLYRNIKKMPSEKERIEFCQRLLSEEFVERHKHWFE